MRGLRTGQVTNGLVHPPSSPQISVDLSRAGSRRRFPVRRLPRRPANKGPTPRFHGGKRKIKEIIE